MLLTQSAGPRKYLLHMVTIITYICTVLLMFSRNFLFFLYLLQIEITSRQKVRLRETEGKACSPLSRKSNVGLNPRILST